VFAKPALGRGGGLFLFLGTDYIFCFLLDENEQKCHFLDVIGPIYDATCRSAINVKFVYNFVAW